MSTDGESSHNRRSLVICSVGTFALFLIGSSTVLLLLGSTIRTLPRNTSVGLLTIALSATLSVVISLIAIPIGFTYMYFFGGVVSTKAIKLYLFTTKGTHVIGSKTSELSAIQASRGLKLKLRRQIMYFGFILAVVVPFATYEAKHKDLPFFSPLARTTDIVSLITQDFVTLTMTASLMLPLVALTLPYFGGLRLRSIDAGPFHTTVLSSVVGASGGFALLYTALTQPILSVLAYIFFLLIGVCWCFALGCNLAADPADRHIARIVLAEKVSSRVVSSKIWLENPPGKFREV
jgi:MFS family permease